MYYIFCRVLIQINLIVPSKIAEEIDSVRLTKECNATCSAFSFEVRFFSSDRISYLDITIWSHKLLKSIRYRFKVTSVNFRLLFILHKSCTSGAKKCTTRWNARYLKATTGPSNWFRYPWDIFCLRKWKYIPSPICTRLDLP